MTSTSPASAPFRDRRSARRRTSALGTLSVCAVLLPALLAGCSTDDDATSAATSAGGGTSASAQLGQCLRDAGYDVDDPDLDEGMVVAVPNGADADEYAAAFAECREGLPESAGGGEAAQEPSAAELAEWQESQLKVAECVRQEGFEDFPDPVDGAFPQTNWSTTSSTPEQDAFFACSERFGPSAEGSGE